MLATLPDDLGELPDGIMGTVKISYITYRHIISRRAECAEWHVELVMHRMAGVIAAPTHIGRLGTTPNKIELYKLADGDPCGVCVSLKCLHGETWVNTAFPLGGRSLQKHLRTGKLGTVEQQQGSLFNNL